MTNGKNGFSMSGFTPREKRVAMLLSYGKSRSEIAKDLGISENTVKTHAQSIFRKSRVNSQKEFMALFYKMNKDSEE